MFIDSVEITVASGKGGAGAVAFRREKFITQGGPEGGDGGRGGDLLFEVDNNTDTLSHYRGNKAYRTQNGRPGGNRNMSGKSGESLILKVPPGTQVIDTLTGELLLDLTEVGKGICFLQGGKGGLGNSHFKSPTNQRPTYAQPGEPGVVRSVRLELKSIADVGLVGFPNVGKSTLISAVSHAKPKVADYEFTTLIPALGVVQASDYSSFIMADIPGILDGASEGRGLGLDFLKHIERTRVLLFVLDAVGYRTLEEQYEALEAELANYAHGLENRHYGIVFSRVDADPAQAAERIEAFLQHKAFGAYEEVQMGETLLKQLPAKAASGLLAFALPISSVSGFGLQTLVYALDELIRKVRSNADRH